MANILYRVSISPTVPASTTAKITALTNSEIDGNWKSIVDYILSLKANTLNGGTGATTPHGANRNIVNWGQLDGHGTITDFNLVQKWGASYVVGSTNGPSIPGASQYYQNMQSLGSEYNWGSGAVYAMQTAIPRTSGGGNPYLSVRFKEGGTDAATWGAWSKIFAGYADTSGTANVASAVSGAVLTGPILTVGGVKLIDLSNSNPTFGPFNPIWAAVRGSGKSLYADEEFLNTSNNVAVYNNSGGTGVVITRESDLTAPNSTRMRMKIVTDGVGLTSPGLGGFVQLFTSRANATFVQIFKALIPVGYTVVIAENSQGTNSTSYWMTNVTGTGKWEDYARVSHCGNTGTFATSGFVYLSGPAGAVTWYLATCNSYDVTAVNYKQDLLVSGTNIKTVNNVTLLGSGNMVIDKAALGLGSVDNTSDATKNIGGNAATATSAVRVIAQDQRANQLLPAAYSKGIEFTLKENTADGLGDGSIYHGVMTIKQWQDTGGGLACQLGFTDLGNMWMRTEGATNTWGPWKKFVTTNTPFFQGAVSTNGNFISNGVNVGLELGSPTVGNTPYIDFNSSGSNIDFDSRIIAGGGTTVNGQGNLSYLAANHYFEGVVYLPNSSVFKSSGGASEGGELRLQKPTTGTTLIGDVVVDVAGDSFRIFDASTAKGFHIDMATAAAGVGSKIYHTNFKPTKTDVGLGSADDTSDVNKPVSTATLTALSAKVDKVVGLPAGVDLNTVITTGFYRLENTVVNGPPGAPFSQLIVSRGGDTASQIVMHYDSSRTFSRGAYAVGLAGITWSAWRETQLRGDSVLGPDSAGVLGGDGAGTPTIEVRNLLGAGNAAYMQFHRQGAFAVRFGLDTDNKLKVGGWSMGAVAYSIFHEGNKPVKADVGLGSADNTSDAAKNIGGTAKHGLVSGVVNNDANIHFTSIPAGSTSMVEGANVVNAPTTDWIMLESIRHTNAGGVWGVQYTHGWEGSGRRLWVRHVSGGTWSAWAEITGKQDNLVSGTNIKTVNGATLLGSGNLTIASGGITRGQVLALSTSVFI